MVMNLRGVKESGAVFSLPTYFFVAMMLLVVFTGLARYAAGTLGVVTNPPDLDTLIVQPITLFLILHAFSSGTTALTGVEAISNGVPAFKEPRSRNASITLLTMVVILATLFLGITFLAIQTDAVPSEHGETVISQITRTVLDGRGLLYLAVVSSTILILILAANTAFADFPRLSAIQAKDGYLPRQLSYQGSRLVYSRGIVALAAIACLLIIIFQANVSQLIPLYAIGVFLSFTLSQSGMARRWRKIGRLGPDEEIVEQGSTLYPDPSWRWKMFLNGFSSVCTFIVMLIFAVTKFTDGAWIVVIIIPILVVVFFRINAHYRELAARLSLENVHPGEPIGKQKVILPISGVHQGTLQALRYARSLTDDITAVHVSAGESDDRVIQSRWEIWCPGVPLVIIDSPYRELMHPLINYIDEIAAQGKPDEVITVVVPEFVPRRWWHNLLHMQSASIMRWALIHHPGVVVVDVPYQVP